MSLHYYRFWQLLLVLVTLVVLMASFYFQYALNLQPCPLCLMQRFVVMALLALTMMAWFFGIAKPAKKIAVITMVFTLVGLFFALRHVWLQSLPADQVPACVPGIDILIRYFPWQDVLHALFWGAGDCAEVPWRGFGLSMPAWTALYFTAMFFAALISYTWLKKNNVG